MNTTVKPINTPVPAVDTKTVDKAINTVISSYNKAEKSFITIACNLKLLQVDDNYKKCSNSNNSACSSFEKFALSAFGFKKSQSYALVGLVDRFGVKNDDGTYYINHDYDTYSQTQLIAMTKLSDKQIADNIKPSMSVSEIKKKVKELLPAPAKTDTEKQKDITASNGVNVVNTTSSNSQALKCYKNFDDFNADIKNIVAMVATVFKKNPNYRITVNYEWTPKIVETDETDKTYNKSESVPMNPLASDTDSNTVTQ